MKSTRDDLSLAVTALPPESQQEPESPYPLPDSIEEGVAKIWTSVLGTEGIRRDDNFLLLGGESLMAMEVAARIQQEFSRDVSIRSILVGTVADVAAEIETA